MTGRSPGADRAYRDTLNRVLALSARDQLALHDYLRLHLAGEVGEETEADRQLRLRREALDAIEATAEYLGLGKDQVPTTKQFDQAAKELGSPWRSGQIIEAFGRWNNAKAAYRGRRVPETAAQRSLRRGVAGRERSYEEYFEGVRIWLRSKPASTRRQDYAAFRHEYNDKLADGERPLVSLWLLTSELGLRWKQVLAIVRGELDVEQAWRERKGEPRRSSSWGDLVSANEAAAILNLPHSRFRLVAQRRGFPLQAVRLGSARAWRRADIEGYAAGERNKFKTRRAEDLQAQIVDAHELRRRLGVNQKVLTRRLRRQQHHLVPEPEGRLGGWIYYWRRYKVERWFKRRSE